MALLKPLPTSSAPAPSNPQPARTDAITSYVSEKKSGGNSTGLLSKLTSATDKARDKIQSWLNGEDTYNRNKAVSEYNNAVKSVRDIVNSGGKSSDYLSKLTAAQDRARQAESALKNANLSMPDNKPSFGDRVVETMLGATKNTAASYVDLARAGMEKGAPTRLGIDTERMQKLDDAAKKATDNYNTILRDVRYNANDPRVIAAKEKMDNAVSFANRYRSGVEKDQSFDERAAAKADELSISAGENIDRAKEGAGFFGRLAVDAGVAGTQLATDAAINAMTGIPTLALVGARSFGGGTQQARLEGANIDQQMAYGAANAAVEMLTEKMADGLAGITGKGAADDIAEEAIRKLASSDAGRTALRTVYGMLGEGAEEFISTAVDPALKSIYDEGEAMQESYRTSEGRKDLLSDALYDALVGAALGVPGSAGSIITGQNAQKNAELRARDAELSGASDIASQLRNDSGNVFLAQNNTPLAQDVSTGEITQPTAQTEATGEAQELNFNPTPTVAGQTQSAPVNQATQPTQAPTMNAYNGNAGFQNVGAETVDSTNGRGQTVNRGFGENVASDYNMEEPLRQSFQEDPGTYSQKTNAETLEKARAIFDANPEEARNTVVSALADAKAGRKLAPEMVPLARMVANNLSRQGNNEAARVILSDVAVELTAAGQLGQAARILRDADPNTALKTIQKALDRINQEARSKGLNWQAELTPEEMRLIESTDFTQEGAYERVYDEISKRVGAEMPSTVWEKLNEIRRVNMLLRPRTLIKNVASNVPMIGVRKMAEGLSAAIQEQMVRSGRMDESERTRARADSYDRQLATDYFNDHKTEILESGNKWDLNTMLRQNRTIFKDTLLRDTAIGEAVSKMTGQEVESFGEALRQVTYWALEQGDNPFVKSAFVDSLAQYCAAQGITDQSQITQGAIDFATANAMEATFKATNVVAKAINALKNDSSPAVSAALDILLPFTTTPANIMNLMGQYSPLGFARLLSKNGKYSLADKVDIFSKASTGTALMALGFALRSLGMITGGEDDDKDKAALDKATGVGNYSIGGRWSYDWAQPVGSLFALGAEISDAIKGQEGWDSAIMNAIYTAGDSALNMSMFQNILSVLKGTGKPTQQIIDAIMEGGATQLMPGLAGDIAKIIDGTVRSTYTGGNVFRDIGAKLQSSLPFASMLMPESVNVRGETNTRGGFMARLLNQTVNPSNYTRGERNDVDEEIYRLYEETGSKTHFPNVSPYKVDYETNSFRMNGKEREQFQKTQGQTYYDLARQAMDSEAYNSLSPEQQQLVLGAIGKYALDSAKRELVDSKGVLYESDWDDETALNNISEYLSAKQAINDAAKVGGSRRNYQGLDDVLANFDNMNQDTKDKLIEGVDYARKLLYSSKKGVGSEQWFADHEAVKAEQKETGKTSDYISGLAITNSESGKTDAEKLQLLEAQLAPSKDGTRNSTVRGYESALGYDIPFDTYTAFLENLRKYDADGNGSFNKREIYNAAGATLKENEVPPGTMAWMLYNSYKKSTAEKYDADGDLSATPAQENAQAQPQPGGLLRGLG